MNCERLRSQAPWLPTRLLDIGEQGSQEWKLVITSDLDTSNIDYITLSYRWGNEPTIKLTFQNLTSLCRGKPISALPQTFKDFIAVAQRLCVKYIWIDSLCIMQDSYLDWQQESVKMQLVYANARCNVAASASAGPEQGLFRSRTLNTILPGLVQASVISSEPIVYSVYDKAYVDRQILSGPLHRRGWVFQECLLAARVLYFTETQIFWTCNEKHSCEVYPVGMPSGLRPLKRYLDILWAASAGTRGTMSDKAADLWANLVLEYSKCYLTKRSDKLVAFSGIATLFKNTIGDDYFAGLWRSRLVEQLSWSVLEPRPGTCSDYVAPSWSWASVDGAVTILRPLDKQFPTTYHASVLDTKARMRNDDPFQQVLQGSITLTGILIRATIPSVNRLPEAYFDYIFVGNCRVKGFFRFDMHDRYVSASDDVQCLLLWTVPVLQLNRKSLYSEAFLLLLKPLTYGGSIYQRLGAFDTSEFRLEDLEMYDQVASISGIAGYKPLVQRTVLTLV